MHPNPAYLLERLRMEQPLLGLYDAPDPGAFAPLAEPRGRACVFSFHPHWLRGETLHLTAERHGCGGCGHWWFGLEGRSREAYITFLAEEEGLRASRELMGAWLDRTRPYEPAHGHLLLGPLRPDRQEHLLTVTFLADPDQLSVLLAGAYYRSGPDDPPAVRAPFGAGCMELLTLLENLEAPQAVVGATDLAMRRHLPPNLLAFTVTKPMFRRLCELDGRSFLDKPFLRALWKSRDGA